MTLYLHVVNIWERNMWFLYIRYLIKIPVVMLEFHLSTILRNSCSSISVLAALSAFFAGRNFCTLMHLRDLRYNVVQRKKLGRMGWLQGEYRRVTYIFVIGMVKRMDGISSKIVLWQSRITAQIRTVIEDVELPGNTETFRTFFAEYVW